MKKFRSAIICLFSFTIVAEGNAQCWKKLKNEVEKAAKETVSKKSVEKTGKETEKAMDSLLEGNKDKLVENDSASALGKGLHKVP